MPCPLLQSWTPTGKLTARECCHAISSRRPISSPASTRTSWVPGFRPWNTRPKSSFDADFLGSWISPVEYTSAYSEARAVEASPPRTAWHVQLESRMSLTGAKADRRIKLAPPEIPAALEHLAVKVARKAGSPILQAASVAEGTRV